MRETIAFPFGRGMLVSLRIILLPYMVTKYTHSEIFMRAYINALIGQPM